MSAATPAEEWPCPSSSDVNYFVFCGDVCEHCAAWMIFGGALALLTAQSMWALLTLLWCSLVLTLDELRAAPAYTQQTVPKEALQLDWAQRTLWCAPTDVLALWHRLSPLSPHRPRHHES